ncbi:hypothetical protein FHT00_001363 [Sphingomonas insulae]|uniref:Uncharacterized protein n=1 Tax=Sphingomonas insulae TaxID=424800 RepID=A0ABN1HQH6_9SPHN|nr:avidin/streptavidin family protein [Sphingomonas insulae]NIJ29430.1 hypothetical protein [Sphingomonas insulae]
MQHEKALALTLAGGHEDADPAASPLLDSGNTWVNELGSTATFTFGANGMLSGTYTSKVSGGGGTISGAITGYYKGYTIAWSVLWPTNPPAITS